MKDFHLEFNKFNDKLKFGEPFAFSRFSDGELRILQNRKVLLGKNDIIIGNIKSSHGWNRPLFEQKEFDPEKHKETRDRLIECLKFKKKNYYKGISCRCCLSEKHELSPEEQFLFQFEVGGLSKNDEDLTWANLFLNSNYPQYLEHMLPYFFNYTTYLVVNENAKLDRVPFPIKKDFRIGNNCMINDVGIIDTLKNYIKENEVKNSLFLVSAATLSNFIIRDLFEFEDSNTYLDIGSSLQPYFQLPTERRYLLGYWAGDENGLQDIQKKCIW